MPKETLVTPESVFEAADTLLKKGRNPSLRAVRDYIGGGSFGAIVPLLQTWRKQQEGTQNTSQNTPKLPPSLMSALDQLAASSADVAEAVLQHYAPSPTQETLSSDKMRHELSELQKLAADQVTRLRQERDQFQQETIQLSHTLLQQKQEILSQHETITCLTEELEDLKEWRERLMPFLKQLSQ